MSIFNESSGYSGFSGYSGVSGYSGTMNAFGRKFLNALNNPSAGMTFARRLGGGLAYSGYSGANRTTFTVPDLTALLNRILGTTPPAAPKSPAVPEANEQPAQNNQTTAQQAQGQEGIIPGRKTLEWSQITQNDFPEADPNLVDQINQALKSLTPNDKIILTSINGEQSVTIAQVGGKWYVFSTKEEKKPEQKNDFQVSVNTAQLQSLINVLVNNELQNIEFLQDNIDITLKRAIKKPLPDNIGSRPPGYQIQYNYDTLFLLLPKLSNLGPQGELELGVDDPKKKLANVIEDEVIERTRQYEQQFYEELGHENAVYIQKKAPEITQQQGRSIEIIPNTSQAANIISIGFVKGAFYAYTKIPADQSFAVQKGYKDIFGQLSNRGQPPQEPQKPQEPQEPQTPQKTSPSSGLMSMYENKVVTFKEYLTIEEQIDKICQK